MSEEFHKFAMRGNVIDLAVCVVIGTAFTAVVISLVREIIMPLVALACARGGAAPAGDPAPSENESLMRSLFLAISLLAATPAMSAGSDGDALAKVARGFYGVYMTLHPSDGIPDAATRAKFAPFMSPSLDQLFVEGDHAEARYAKATKGQSPPLVEGDLFTPNFEGATSFRLGACETDRGGGHCAVTLSFDDKKAKPLVWTDTVYLVRTPQGFRVDDIAYGGNWDFGNRGRLTDTLKSAIRDGNEFSK